MGTGARMVASRSHGGTSVSVRAQVDRGAREQAWEEGRRTPGWQRGGEEADNAPAMRATPTVRPLAQDDPQALLDDLRRRLGASWVGWSSNAGGAWASPGLTPASGILLASQGPGERARQEEVADGEVAGGRLVALGLEAATEASPTAAELAALAMAVDRARRAPGLGRLLDQGIRAAAVIHDLRNRLSALSLGVTRARLEPSPEALQLLEADVLAASRACSQRLDHGPEDDLPLPAVPLAPVLERALGQARRSRRAGAGSLPAGVSAEPVTVLVPGPRLQDALANLLLNAAEAAGPSGEVTLAVEPRPTEARVDVVITNPGRPLHADAFRPGFTRGGSGLGLSAVSAATEGWGGWLSTRSGGGLVEVRLGLLALPEEGCVEIVLDPLPPPRAAEASSSARLWTPSPSVARRWITAFQPHAQVAVRSALGWELSLPGAES